MNRNNPYEKGELMTTAKDLLRKDYVSTDIKETVAKLIGKLKKAGTHSALVFDGKKYLGLVSRRFLLTSRIDPSEMKVGNIIKKRSKAKTPFFVPKLEENTDIKQICKLMTTSDTDMLPVLKKEQVLGIVHAHDVANEIAREYARLTCDELASKPAITARPNDQIIKIITVFSREAIDHLPVVDEQNRLMGMVAMSDLAENPQAWNMSAQKISQAASHQGGKHTGYAHGEKTKMMNLPIQNYMSTRQICCTPPETKIPDAIKTMEENNVCSIVLVKYDKPVGILTIKDLLMDYAK